MAKQYIYFKGKGKWFQHLFMLDSEFKKWHVTLYFTPESLDEFRALNLKTHLKKDDDGYFAKLSRPSEKAMGGTLVAFTPPKVFDADGLPILEGSRIGNGSDITVKCELYQYTPPGGKAKANAIRLESVRVDNLVPYVPSKDYTQSDAKAAEGLMQQPEPLF